MLREDGGSYYFAWTGNDADKDLKHYEIANRRPESKLLGGGLIWLSTPSLNLVGESFDFGMPPFDLVHDVAKAIVQAVRPVIPVTEIEVQGYVEYQYSVKG